MEDLWEVGWLIILEGKAHGWGMLKDSNSGQPKTGNIQLPDFFVTSCWAQSYLQKIIRIMTIFSYFQKFISTDSLNCVFIKKLYNFF